MIAKRLFLPGVLLAIVALLALSPTNSPSRAAPVPTAIDLVGTWDLVAESIESDAAGPWSYVFSSTMTVTGQEGRLFWGEYVDSGGVWPMNGAMMSSETSSTTFCITFMPNAAGYGSITVVAGKGGRPPQVAMEALVTSGGLQVDGGAILSAHMVATKRPPNVYSTP